MTNNGAAPNKAGSSTIDCLTPAPWAFKFINFEFLKGKKIPVRPYSMSIKRGKLIAYFLNFRIMYWILLDLQTKMI